MISTFLRDCTKNVAGQFDTIFLAAETDIASYTFTEDVLTALTMESGKQFAAIQVDKKAGSQFTASGTQTKGYLTEESLILNIRKYTKTVMDLINELKDISNCGIVAIRIDNNGNGWVGGLAPETYFYSNRPYMAFTKEYDTGASIEDAEEGNKTIITLTRTSGADEFPIDEAMTKSLTMDKDAVFVDWGDSSPA